MIQQVVASSMQPRAWLSQAKKDLRAAQRTIDEKDRAPTLAEAAVDVDPRGQHVSSANTFQKRQQWVMHTAIVVMILCYTFAMCQSEPPKRVDIPWCTGTPCSRVKKQGLLQMMILNQ